MSTVNEKLFVVASDHTQSSIKVDVMADKSPRSSLEERMSQAVVLSWLPPTPREFYLSPRESAYRDIQQALNSPKMFLFSPKGLNYIPTPRDEVFIEPPKQSRFSFNERIVQVLEPDTEELSEVLVNLLKRKLNIAD